MRTKLALGLLCAPLLLACLAACTSRSPAVYSKATSRSGTQAITPGWTVPAPPNAVVGQSYTASVPAVSGDTYAWTVTAGSASLINATTAVLTFTPKASGTVTLHCVQTDAAKSTRSVDYSLTAATGPTLNAEPASISVGQGTILLATFTGTTGTINPGSLSVTSGVGLTVRPSATTTYTLSVDGTPVATATVTVLTYTPKFVYVSNSNDETISGFSLDASSGALTALSGSPFRSPDSKYMDQIATSPDSKFLFAAGQSGTVYAFSIDSTSGALTSVSGSPFTANASIMFNAVAADPFDRFVYAHGQDGKVYGFSLDSTSGALTAISGSPWAAGSNSSYYGGIVVHPAGSFLYVADSGDTTVTAFAIDQSSGALTKTSGSPYDVSYSGKLAMPFGVAIDNSGSYFFTKGESGTSYLAALAINLATGDLTSATGSPYGPLVGEDAFHGLCAHPTKDFVYISFYESDSYDAAAYSLNPTSGALSPLSGSPYDLFSVHGSDNIVVDRSGQFAFSTDFNGGLISAMRVDSSTGGLLTLAGVAVFGENETTVAVGKEPDSIAIAGALE
ncbi:MAG: beta-propeller fold lactonase family protein [Holophaga sp.]|nr:beta-propeller fold lactonase family protein [Holophaga sp.]